MQQGPIGIFDSGYGGLTILSAIRRRLPQYSYLYLGDNARAPYGTRSFDIVYQFTLEAVKALFERGCHLVILACNTASAKALRTIQQRDLPQIDPSRRVLGVIRPTVETLGSISHTGHIGIFATQGTVDSHSYDMEIAKLHPSFTVTSMACPMWVPLIENGEAADPGADYFVDKYVGRMLRATEGNIDTIILGCTHYPILYPKIRQAVPPAINVISQGEIVANSLADYLERHPEMERRCRIGATCTYLTTESPEKFSASAGIFLKETAPATRILLQ
ncbi:MAG: glutamate racemase [Pseudoflavonifractor sp.]|nr:glutamate racemase [Alloprevotella sp.]MCM1116469.1 glutamate racemase [Pseudoflavonifractor sp.]